MFSMTKQNLIDMYYGKKVSTLRKYSPNFKGCAKVGNVYLVKKGLFDKDYCFKIKILNRYFVNINAVTDFNNLGYDSLQDYLEEDFNKQNDSDLRVRYDFVIVETNEEQLLKLGVIN